MKSVPVSVLPTGLNGIHDVKGDPCESESEWCFNCHKYFGQGELYHTFTYTKFLCVKCLLKRQTDEAFYSPSSMHKCPVCAKNKPDDCRSYFVEDMCHWAVLWKDGVVGIECFNGNFCPIV